MDPLNKFQFVYKREVEVPAVETNIEKGIVGTDAYTKTVYDSFNINNVVRSMTMDDGGMLVLLDDIHQRFENRPKINPTNGNPKKDKHGRVIVERVQDTFQSEIMLSAEEAEQFLKLTGINYE